VLNILNLKLGLVTPVYIHHRTIFITDVGYLNFSLFNFIPQADKEKLGEMLLSNVCKSNRLLMALILRVEHREFLQECLTLVDKWLAQVTDLGEGFIPFDSPFHIPESSKSY
jgi:hypothetical protein